MKNFLTIYSFCLCLLCCPTFSFGAILFQENFDDTSYSSRGWYDGNTGAIDNSEHISGSTASMKCHFLLGGTKCNPADGQYIFRNKFTPSNSVYLSYWVKHSSNWVGSGTTYHPHVFLFITNLNADYAGLAYTYLTAYVEENQGYPVLSLQDGQNIDETKIGVNLTTVTENRAVAGCNGTQLNMGQSGTDCYLYGSVHWNGTVWKGPTAYFVDPNQKTAWHFIEAYFQLNTISNGIGQQDGIIRYWYDGQLVIEHSNIILRTGKNPTMQFNQFVIAPYIGNGSPVDQTFWIDNLTVATSRPTTTLQPSPPTNLQVK
jgi:hypothetical protein